MSGEPTGDDARVATHAEMLANRVRKRFAHLSRRFAREGIEAFRLYDWDIPEVRAVVDWYAGHIVVAEYARRQTGPEWLPAMGRAAGEALQVAPDRVHLRLRRTGAGDGPRYERLASTGRRFPVRERDLTFLVNLDDFLDTGLFPDHRETRAMVRAMAGGKDFLNLYGYTGSFTCAAAAGGARSTVTVDRSATCLDWAADNLALNRLVGEGHDLVRADANEFLDRAAASRLRFSLAVVDPPSFSTTRGATGGFDVQRDHPDLLRRVLAVVAPGCTVLFSTNHQRFEPRLEGLSASEVTEITEETVPEDYRNRRVHRCFRITAASSSPT